MVKRTRMRAVVIAAMTGSSTLGAVSAWAQDQQLERVEVTGSAIKRIDAETAVPVTVLKMEDLKKQGVTSVEQILSTVSSMQSSVGTSQSVGANYAGASFADLRGIGPNKTLVLLNGRRIANNAFDGSAPDMNMIPFAALQSVEILRDGASALYGTDAIGGVINFITRKDFQGGTITISGDAPLHTGGGSQGFNAGYGYGDLDTNGFNIFGFIDYNKQEHLSGTNRPYNTRYPGGLSPTTNPANYYQDGNSGNVTAPSCGAGTFLIPDATGFGCQMTTSSFVDYIPETERTSGMLKGTVKINENHQFGLEYFASQSVTLSTIAPVPYGGLYMNRLRPDGTPNPYYPGNAGGSITTPNIPLNPAYTEADPTNPAGSAGAFPGLQPGFIHVKWRDLPNGARQEEDTNLQQRIVASLEGTLFGWDYQAAATYNQNDITQKLLGYSNGDIITAGVLNGVINPFGPQSAEGDALISSAALNGTLEKGRGTVTGFDAHASREVGDWLGAGHQAALALGVEYRHENFVQQANSGYATLVQSSTGIDPNTLNAGSRDVAATYAELNVPILKTLDVTAAVRYDKYSDFGNTTNPKLSIRFQPIQQVLLRASYSTGFRAPSLYDINAAQAYTNTSQVDDPVRCPNGTAIPGAPAAANCQQQFQALTGGNKTLRPEKSKNASFGIVVEPVTDLSVGLDFWWIKLTQTIGSIPDTTVFGSASSTFTSLYHRLPSGALSTDGSQCPNPLTCGYVDLRTQNLGGTNTNGVDLSASYRLRTSGVGNFSFGLQSTYVTKYEYQDYEGGPWNQNVGAFVGTGPIFRWQHNLTAVWSLDKVTAGLTGHYKSGYTDQLDQVAGYRVPSYTTWDAFASVQVTKGLSLTGGLKNIFDRDPPLSYQVYVFQAGYDPRYSDPLGRTAYVRGTYTF